MSIQRLILSIILLCGCSRWLVAGELTARDLATPEMAVLIEVARPVQLIDNPLSRDVWGLVREAPGINEAFSTPEIDKFRHVAKFIEKSLGGDWQTGISRLTAGGIIVVVQPPKPPAEPDVTVVVTAADEQSLRQFMDAVQAEIRRASGSGKGPEAESASYRSFAVHRVGNGSYTIAGRQLVVSNTKAGLESAIDRLAGAGAARPFELPQSLRLVDQAGNPPAILATVNLKLLRQDPKTSDALKFPANDPIPVFLLGGYLDLLRRADHAALGLFVDGPSHELKVRVPVGTDGAYAGLRGYFASEPNESAPALLRPPGAIYSAGWFRDYKKLWDARRDLFNADLVKQIEMADANARSQPTGFGISDVLQWIGPQFRFVAARQREQVYPKKVDERLPAVALVIGVRDEMAVRDRILAPVDGLLLVALNKNIDDYKKLDYRDARITTFRFSEAAAGADPNNPTLYHLNPAYTLARGQLIIGSTAEIVRDVIDDLDRQAAAPARTEPSAERFTDQQELFLGDISDFLREFHERFVRGAILKQGLTHDDAAKELGVLHSLFGRVGSVRTGHVIANDHFEIFLQAGPNAGSGK